MPDDDTEVNEVKESSESTAVKAPEAAVLEAQRGSEDLTQKVADYYEARKDGLRDKDTLEHLPPQPTFFDSLSDDSGKSLVAQAHEVPAGQAPEAAPPPGSSVEDKVAELRKATKKDDLVDLGTDEDTIHKVLEKASPDERKEIADKYKEKYGVDLEQDLRSEMDGKDLDRALIALKADPDTAAKLTEVRDGLGDKDKIVKTLEDASPEERKKIADQYEKTFGKPLEEDLKEELSGKDLEEALTALRRPAVPDEVKNAAASPEQLKRVMESVDADKDGKMSKEEVAKALKDNTVTGDDAKVLKEVQKNYDSIANLTNDQWGSEDEITKDDLDKFGKLQTTEKQDTDTRRDLEAFTDKNYAKLDKDKDGFLTKDELDKALADPAASEQDKKSLQHMRDHFDSIQSTSNDEWGSENDGITRKDVQDWAKEKSETPEASSIRDVDTRVERERLDKALDAHTPPISDAKKAEFRQNMEAFEKRAAEKGLPPDEVAKTYREVTRVLDAQGNSPMSPTDREKIAEQVMQNAAHPTDVVQGGHGTCNVSVVETMMYSKSPSAAAKMVADVSTTGEFTAKDGTHVKLHPDCMKQDAEASSGSGRNFASQMFQVTAVNVELQKHHPNQEFIQHPGNTANVTNGVGEELRDKTTGLPVTNADGSLHDFAAGFSTEKVAETYNTISGKENFDVGLTAPPFSDKPIHASPIENEKQLDDKLAQLKKENKLPTAVWVHTSGEPFWTDSGGGSAGGAGGATGGGHYVTVTDYDPGPPAKVAIDNQWGRGSDHQWDRPGGGIDTSKGITTHDLFTAMHDPGDMKALVKKDVDWNREHGKVDTGKEFEYLRMQRMTGEITTTDYAKNVNNEIARANERWKEQKAANPPTFDQAEHDRAAERIKQAINFLPPGERMRALGNLAQSDVMPPADTDKAIQDNVNALLRDKANKMSTGTWTAADQQNYARYNRQLNDTLAKLPPDRQTAIKRQIAASAPAGAPTLV